ncbi:MAG: hypothetical protein ACREPM_19100, partial [Gemmatimonadaceae bacterium]
MATYDELVAQTAAIRKVLDGGARARLMAIPGVTQVSYGAKELGNRPTRELCIRVYVKEKKPLSDVSAAERIPTEIDGIPTDVNIVQPYKLIEDDGRYRPVLGGISISNKVYYPKNGETTWAVGTFGCTATRNTGGKPVLLSNHHVLKSHGAQDGDYIFQPGPVDPPNIPIPTAPLLHPPKDDDMIAKIIRSVLSPKVDAAIAELDVSSCCRCCGLDCADEVTGLSESGTPPSNKILGMREPMPTKSLYKVGMMTGRTEGLLVDPNLDLPDYPLPEGPHSFTGQLSIASSDENKPFAWDGDSGSVIIDEDGYIVGLLFGATHQIDAGHRAYANHIIDVCSELHITINLSTTTHTSAPSLWVPAGAPSNPEPVYQAARARLLADPAGAWLFALGEVHRDEIVRLVTTHRPVTVAWHRAGGPALFNTGLKTLRAGGDVLPMPADGARLDAALEQVGNALAAHGSPE